MTIWVRRGRSPSTCPEAATLSLASPPRPVVGERSGLGQALLGGLGSLGMIGFALVGGSKVFLYVAVGMSVLTVAGALGARLGARRRSRASRSKASKRWRAHLADLVDRAETSRSQQRHWLMSVHPQGGALLARARGAPGLWERRPEDDDAWDVCLGSGLVPARVALTCTPGADPLAEVDEELAACAAAAVSHSLVVVDAPVVLRLQPASTTVLLGPAETTRAVARSLIAQLLAARPPGELSVTIAAADPCEWQWLAWAPHDVTTGALAGVGLLLGDGVAVSPGVEAVGLMLAESWSQVPSGATVVDLAAVPMRLGDGQTLVAPSMFSAVEAEGVARLLSPRRLSGARGVAGASTLALLGMPAPTAASVLASWAGPGGLAVPLGVDPDGSAVTLDLAEAGAGGDGPHGLLVGATGSGKSELLRSLVLSLALRHPPDRLAFVLVDWKGGAAFDDVSDLPHVAGLMTNLGDDAQQINRLCVSLRAELERRQRLLRAAGAESVAAWRSGPQASLCPPSLLVVLDEFGELLAAEPDVLDVLTAIGRLGRSLGVHLLLSSQRFEEGRLRGLESHLRYRVCLRLQSTMESQAVIGSPLAATLPAEPGWGYVCVDGRLRRFRGAHSSQPVDETEPPASVTPLKLSAAAASERADGPSERAVAVAAVRDLQTRPAAAVWLPPLPRVIPATAVPVTAVPPAAVPPTAVPPTAVPTTAGPAFPGPTADWSLPIGIADDIAGQAQPVWCLELAGHGVGHVGLTAGPGAGASGFLRSVAVAAVAAHPPGRLQLTVLDYGGGLADLAVLPHLRCLAGPEHPELAEAALREVAEIIGQRTRLLRASGTTPSREWRAFADSNLSAGDRADLLVLVDGLARAREDVPDIDNQLALIAAGGLRVGVRLLVTTQRTAELRPGLRDLLDTRLEMRLADPADSLLTRNDARRLVGAPPGRLLTAAGLEVQITAPEPIERWCDGVAAPRLHPLSPRMPSIGDELAIRAGDLAPVGWDGRGHLLVLGDRRSGRTSLLARVAQLASRDPLARRVLLVDPRRGLTHLADRPGVRWTSGGADTESAVQELAADLGERRLAARASAEARHGQRWWQGPEHLVVIDDADLLPGGSYAGPLTPLAELLRPGPDLGLSVALARPVTGLARHGFEPFLAGLREAAETAILLAGDPAEGPVIGGLRARPDLPPGRASWISTQGCVEVQLVAPQHGEAGDAGAADGGGRDALLRTTSVA